MCYSSSRLTFPPSMLCSFPAVPLKKGISQYSPLFFLSPPADEVMKVQTPQEAEPRHQTSRVFTTQSVTQHKQHLAWITTSDKVGYFNILRLMKLYNLFSLIKMNFKLSSLEAFCSNVYFMMNTDFHIIWACSTVHAWEQCLVSVWSMNRNHGYFRLWDFSLFSVCETESGKFTSVFWG